MSSVAWSSWGGGCMCGKGLSASLRLFSHSPLLLSPQTSISFPLSAVCAFTVLLGLMSLGRGCSLQLSRSSTLNVPQGIILHTANWTLNSYCLHEKLTHSAYIITSPSSWRKTKHIRFLMTPPTFQLSSPTVTCLPCICNCYSLYLECFPFLDT